jgi:hypothetical protein
MINGMFVLMSAADLFGRIHLPLAITLHIFTDAPPLPPLLHLPHLPNLPNLPNLPPCNSERLGFATRCCTCCMERSTRPCHRQPFAFVVRGSRLAHRASPSTLSTLCSRRESGRMRTKIVHMRDDRHRFGSCGEWRSRLLEGRCSIRPFPMTSIR